MIFHQGCRLIPGQVGGILNTGSLEIGRGREKPGDKRKAIPGRVPASIYCNYTGIIGIPILHQERWDLVKGVRSKSAKNVIEIEIVTQQTVAGDRR
jgi:hypothetical protein